MKNKKTQSLWKKAKKIIPGGNMLLSKRPEMCLPDKWPAYYKEAKGCFIKDLDGKKYKDFCLMGVGTNVLGYSYDEVDKEVLKAVKMGNMSSLNCEAEVELSERLLKIHNWADMVKLARTGGEANSIAVRIARAWSNKDNIAVCGYHGWHDWYLSANIKNNKNLDDHLLKGLSTKGVPRSLSGTTFTFKYNDFDELEKIVNKHDIGIIKMEIFRNFPPEDNFLQKVRELSTKKKIVLIFDECTTGFRETYGGLHKKYKVNPDLCIFGKALGNGYAITAVLGKKHIMDVAQSTFISSTFWTERIGPTAALKTLEVMKKIESWKLIKNKGLKIKREWLKIAKKNNLPIQIQGTLGVPNFSFQSINNLKYKTLISQEMLKKNFLCTNTLYISVAHTDELIEDYLYHLEKVFKLITNCENGYKIDKYLKHPVCHAGFQRLN